MPMAELLPIMKNSASMLSAAQNVYDNQTQLLIHICQWYDTILLFHQSRPRSSRFTNNSIIN